MMTPDRNLSRASIRNRIRALRGLPPALDEGIDGAVWDHVVISTADGRVVIANDGSRMSTTTDAVVVGRSEIETGFASISEMSQRRDWLMDLIAIKRAMPDATVERVTRVKR